MWDPTRGSCNLKGMMSRHAYIETCHRRKMSYFFSSENRYSQSIHPKTIVAVRFSSYSAFGSSILFLRHTYTKMSKEKFRENYHHHMSHSILL